jgi:TetR/AcrR family transcriptional regulator, transcriptional repressor for nem operon
VARPREFDESDVVDRASLVFWRRGYDGCSIGDLIEATQLQRQSLYNTFGDKHGLFLAVLARYRERLEGELASIDREEAGLTELRAFMEGVLATQRALGTRACMMVITAFGPQIDDPEIRRAVESGAESMRACFARLIARAKRAGDVRREIDPDACAAYLYGVLNGLSALVRTGGTEQELESSLSLVFDALGVKKKRSGTRNRRS